MTGQKISHYELLDKLGEGGMGVVYKARDVLLNRSAALKLLPPGSEVSDDQRRRLIQEAQSASALNHPNIVTVYEVGQSDGRDFIAMELAPGQILETLIGPKGMPTREALSCAIQIADALAAAHAAGIVHRDLKPGNVMVSESGRVKVLDFGLAKSSGPLEVGASNVTRTIMAGPKTAEGTIVGTVSYMSPEQAEGKPVDHRSDIFAFGAVLYEMLTGQRAFQGDTPVSTLAAVLHVEPREVTSSETTVPRPLDRIVRHCLAKSPDRRWQSMADVRMALEDFNQDLESGQPAVVSGAATPAATQASKRWIAIPIAAAVVLPLIATMLWRSRPKEAPLDQYSIRRLTSDNGASVTPAISADGKLVAYASDRSGEGPMDIWIQQLAGGDPVRLTRDLVQCSDPAFSPDGSKIVFYSEAEGGGIHVISALGGTPRKIGQGSGPQFSSDGARVSYLSGNNSIMLVSAMGGTPREIRTKHTVISKPLWSPDGKGLLYLGAGTTATDRDWFFVNENGDEAPTGAKLKLAKVFEGGFLLRPSSWTTDGAFLYTGTDESMNIYLLPFDPAAKRATGSPKQVTVAPGFNFHPSASRDSNRITFGSGVNVTSNLWRVDIDSSSGKATAEPTRITEGLENRVAPYPSADGNQLAYVSTVAGVSEARIRTLATGKEIRLAEASAASSPVLTEDGSKLAYYVGRDSSTIYEVAARGGVPRQICAKCGRPTQWIQNGTKLLYDRAGPKQLDLAVLNVSTGQSKIIVEDSKHQFYSPQVSPDGRLLCFTEVSDGRNRRIYVAPFAGEQSIDKNQWTVATEGPNFDRQPVWSPKGSLLYFLSERDGYRCVWGQRIDAPTGKQRGEPFAVRHFHQTRYSLSDFGDTAQIGLSFAANQMFFSMREIQSNIWLAERQHPKTQ